MARRSRWRFPASVLQILELAQLRERVMPEGFVQWSVAVLIRQIQAAVFSHQKL